MKRIISLLVILGLLVGVAGVYSADAAAKKVMKKKVMKKKAVKKAAPKKAMPAPSPVAPLPPPPPPTVVAPAPAPVAAGALFGLGVNSLLKLDYGNYGKGMLGTIVLRGDVVLDDIVGLGSMVGLSSKSVKYTVGLGGLYGRDVSDNLWRAIPIYFGGIINIPADVMGGIESYLSGGLNYPISGTKTGVIGGGISYGIKGDLGLGLGGKTSVELGWSIVRATNPTRSSKGLTISVGQDLAL